MAAASIIRQFTILLLSRNRVTFPLNFGANSRFTVSRVSRV